MRAINCGVPSPPEGARRANQVQAPHPQGLALGCLRLRPVQVSAPLAGFDKCHATHSGHHQCGPRTMHTHSAILPTLSAHGPTRVSAPWRLRHPLHFPPPSAAAAERLVWGRPGTNPRHPLHSPAHSRLPPPRAQLPTITLSARRHLHLLGLDCKCKCLRASL